LMNKS